MDELNQNEPHENLPMCMPDEPGSTGSKNVHAANEETDRMERREDRARGVNEQWSGGTVTPQNHEEELMRQLGPQYTGRDNGEELQSEKLGP